MTNYPIKHFSSIKSSQNLYACSRQHIKGSNTKKNNNKKSQRKKLNPCLLLTAAGQLTEFINGGILAFFFQCTLYVRDVQVIFSVICIQCRSCLTGN